MSMFADIHIEDIPTNQNRKQPVWEPHAPLEKYATEKFSFRTISSSFAIGGKEYKVSCFQMKTGYFSDRNSTSDYTSNVGGGIEYGEMLQHCIAALEETGLNESFGLDSSTFTQDKGKSAYRNMKIYIMPKLSNGVRQYIDAQQHDLVKKEATAVASKPATGWGALKPPATTTEGNL